MKPYLRPITASLFVLLLFLAFVAIPVSQAAPTPEERSGNPAAPSHLAPVALRRISIPFGVADVLTLSSDGRSIQVTGHAECPEDAERFSVNVIAAQDPPGGYGDNGFIAPVTCEEGEVSWESVVTAQEDDPFVEGEAWVCVTSLFFSSYEERGLFRWCYEDVLLEVAEPVDGGHIRLPLVIKQVVSGLVEWSSLGRFLR